MEENECGAKVIKGKAKKLSPKCWVWMGEKGVDNQKRQKGKHGWIRNPVFGFLSYEYIKS
jgi:hypothetical protein